MALTLVSSKKRLANLGGGVYRLAMRLDLSRPVLCLALAETIMWAALFYTFPILLLRFEASFGWARGEVALAFTITLGVAALASPFAGRLIDRGLARWSLPGAAVLGAIALLTLSIAETKAAFYAAWALIGLASSACLYEACFAFLTRIKGGAARGAITTVTLVAGLASTLCFPLADWLADAWGWRTAITIFAGGAAFIAAPCFALSAHLLEERPLHPAALSHRTKERAAARAALQNPLFWLLAGCFPALALTHGMTISHLLPMLADRGLSSGAAVVAASLIGPCQVAGRIAMTAAGPNRAPSSLALLAFGAVVGAACLFLVAHHATMIFAGAILFGAGYGILSIVRPLVTADFLGRPGFGAISGALAMPYIACSAIAPFLAAQLWSLGGYDLMLSVGAALACLGIALMLIARRRHAACAAIDPARTPR